MPSVRLMAHAVRTRSVALRFPILAIAIAAFAGAAGTAVAKPRPEELWQRYPLGPQRRHTAAPPSSVSPTLARTAGVAQARSASSHGDTSALPIAASALLTLLASGAVGLRLSRRRRAASAAAGLRSTTPTSPRRSSPSARRRVPIRIFDDNGEARIEMTPSDGSTTSKAEARGWPTADEEIRRSLAKARTGLRTVPDAMASHDPPGSGEPATGSAGSGAAKARANGHEPPVGHRGTHTDAKPDTTTRGSSRRSSSRPEQRRDAAQSESKAQSPGEARPEGAMSTARGKQTGSGVERVHETEGLSRRVVPELGPVAASRAEALARAAEAVGSPASARAVQRCAIVVYCSGAMAEFHVVPVGQDGRDDSPVACSRSFALPPSGMAPGRDQRRCVPEAVVAIHEDLVRQLAAVGWRREESDGAWYEAVFVRDAGAEAEVERCAVTCRRHGRQAHFEARQWDDYGNQNVLASSPPLSLARWRRRVRPTQEARLLHDTLMRYLERECWEPRDSFDGRWYATTLVRPRTRPTKH
jgi:hypothetical protein